MSQLHIRGLSWFKLIFCIASSSQDILEQMNEGGGLILSTEAKKKKRGSGFRYSNKKDLEGSKLKRALSYPRAQSSGGVSGSTYQVVHSALRELRNKMVMKWI
jgi:hypothetical protein